MAAKAKAGRARGGKSDELVVGGDAKARKAGPRSWTKAKAQAFLTALGETCNVTLACAEAGVSSGAAYARRGKDAAFRAAWREAIATAYRRLELVLLERAFNGTEKVMTRKDGSEERVREYPNQIALALLKMHRDEAIAAEHEYQPAEVDELRARLIDKLERLRKRDFAGEKE